jgi:two-component system, OmpR family, sensor histidine kinase KdpD
MLRRGSRWLSLGDRPPLGLGILVAALSVAAITALIFPLRTVSPAVSNGVLYLVAVLLISTAWGLRLGLLTSVASAAAFNFFHIPPTGTFTIADGRNWVALAVFLFAAVVTGSLAEAARARAAEADRRREEADLAAELARVLLGGTDLAESVRIAGERLASALGAPWATISLDPPARDPRHETFPLCDGGARVGTVEIPADLPDDVRARVRERVVPALEALLGAELERERLAAEVVETRALRRSDVVKTALLRSVSHDLRSPITAILAAGDALGSETLSVDERRELSDAVRTGGERLARLVDKLLDLSRLEAGTAEPRPDWISIDEVVAGAVDESPVGGRFELSIDPELPLVRADAAQLERAIANLLENAARYSGELPVSVRARAVGPRLLIRVVDRGPGIPSAELERIFEPFYRVPGDAGHRGSGLGLAIARGFVEANGGRVWAESLPGQGTSFVIALPLSDSPATTGVA